MKKMRMRLMKSYWGHVIYNQRHRVTKFGQRQLLIKIWRTWTSTRHTSHNVQQVKMTFSQSQRQRRMTVVRWEMSRQWKWLDSQWHPKCHQFPSLTSLKTILTHRQLTSTRKNLPLYWKFKLRSYGTRWLISLCHAIMENQISSILIDLWKLLDRQIQLLLLVRIHHRVESILKEKIKGWKLFELIYRHWLFILWRKSNMKSINKFLNLDFIIYFYKWWNKVSNFGAGIKEFWIFT